ncbi:MAG: DUF4157 domain-containing protein [Chloroflexi bacterium]|nr:DUF4157 domain-containing protein [Chloroflexota bacterium]MCL5273224.1 DUF4157 domain-containing protein [Chloroflexota bacterium]
MAENKQQPQKQQKDSSKTRRKTEIPKPEVNQIERQPVLAPTGDMLPGIVQRAAVDIASVSQPEMDTLQNTLGMRAVQRMARRAAGATGAKPDPRQSLRRMLSNRGIAVQAKLTVGAADDAYEQEADRVAARALAGMTMQTPADVSRREDEGAAQRKPLAAGVRRLLQRETTGLSDSFEAGEQVERALSHAGGGSPLPETLRTELEPKYGADFSRVQVHTGAQSEQLNRAVGAQAFTHGEHIYMGEGKYNPGTSAGKRLLAHELTHVVQQGGAGVQRKQPGSVQRQELSGGRPNRAPVMQKSPRAIRRLFDASMPGLLTLDSETNLRGEVGQEGTLSKGAIVYAPSAVTSGSGQKLYMLPVEAKAIVHDINDKNWRFIQIPSDVMAKLADPKERGKASEKLDKQESESLYQKYKAWRKKHKQKSQPSGAPTVPPVQTGGGMSQELVASSKELSGGEQQQSSRNVGHGGRFVHYKQLFGSEGDDTARRRLYKKLVLKLHPDKNPGEDTTSEFQAMHSAYQSFSSGGSTWESSNELGGATTPKAITNGEQPAPPTNAPPQQSSKPTEQPVEKPLVVKGVVNKNKITGVSGTHKMMTGSLFPHPPVPDDVQQRGIGNCYFVAALSAVARSEPEMIRNMLTDLGDGTVSVRFFRAVKKDDNSPASYTAEYVRVRKTEVKVGGMRLHNSGAPWVGMATKAYAAWSGHDRGSLPGYSGSYAGTEGGWMSSAWEHILGRPSAKLDILKAPETPSAMPSTDEERQAFQESLAAGTAFVEPWSPKLTGKAQYRIQPGDTISSVAQKHGLTPQDLRKLLHARYAGFSGYPKLIDSLKDGDDISQASAVTDTAAKGIGVGVTVKIASVALPEGYALEIYIPDMPEADRRKWAQYANQNYDAIGAKIKESQKVGKKPERTFWQWLTKKEQPKDKRETHGVTTLEIVRNIIDDAKLSQQGKEALMRYCHGMFGGTPDQPVNTYVGVDLFQKIYETLAKGGYVGLGSQKFGGGGGSTGEDTESVVGIAGGHAYDVVDTIPAAKNKNAPPPEDGRLYLIVRNPWGSATTEALEYDKNFKAMTKWAKSGEYKIEISDVIRYFNNVYYNRPRESHAPRGH